MNTNRFRILLILVLMFSMSALGAPIVMSYGSLTSPDGGTTPGYYNGSGNSSDNFTIATSGPIEVGLKAKIRGGADIDGSSGIYIAPVGGGSNPAYAQWNVDFSVNYQLPGMLGTRTFSNTTSIFGVTNMLTGLSNAVNIPQYWPDSPGFGPRGKETPAMGDDWGAQNSQNMGFGDFPKPGPPAEAFNPNASFWYKYTLSVYDTNSQALLDTVSINVMSADVAASVPEPMTFVLMGAGLIGIAALRRRKV